jgi:hypothetical protein
VSGAQTWTVLARFDAIDPDLQRLYDHVFQEPPTS